MGDTPFVTPTELATFLRAPSLASEADLVEALTAALEWVAEQVGPLVRDKGAERTYAVWPSGHCLVLPDTRLQAVGAITTPDGTVVDVPPGRIDLLAGVIHVQQRGRLTEGVWTVTAIPRDANTSMALAVKIIASHLYEIHRARAGDPRTHAALTGVATPVAGPGPKGFAIPHRAAQLLAPFLRGK